MAELENLEIVVDVDIAGALSALSDLQDELRDVAEEIEAVDAIGSEGIQVRTQVDDLDTELARVKAEMEAFEGMNELNIDTDIDHQRLEALRGVMRDAIRDATEGGIEAGTRAASGAVGGGDGDGFNAPFLAEGTRGAARMPEISEGMDLIFGGRNRRREGLFEELFKDVGESVENAIESIEEFDLRMSDVHNALARLVPLILLFVGTLPAVITAVVGLAAAAASAAAALLAIGGLGALGVGLVDGQFSMDRLTDVLEGIRDDFIEAFAPLAERLEPVFMDAVDGLDMFFQSIANQGDALMQLTDEARAFGGFVMDFFPDVLRMMAGLVEALSPQLAAIGTFLQNNLMNIVRTLVQLTVDALPAVSNLIQQLMRAIPPLIEFSIGMTMVASAVLDTIGLLTSFLNKIGISSRILGIVIGSVLALATAVLLLNSAFGTALILIGKYAAALVAKAVPSLATYISSTWLATFATQALRLAIIGLLAVTGVGLILAGLSVGASAMGSSFLGASKDIDAATRSLKEFDRVSSRTAGGTFNPYTPDDPSDAADTTTSGGTGTGTTGSGDGNGSTTINIESSGDDEQDKSTAKYAAFRMGRTTGVSP
jgi:hypothetical protein